MKATCAEQFQRQRQTWTGKTILGRPMDFHAFASLAHIRVLLIPVGSIPRATFETCAAEIRTFHDIRLGDIPTDSKGDRGASDCWHPILVEKSNLLLLGFMPNPLSSGHLHLSFPSRPPSSAYAPLSLLRPSHFPLAVIGVAACYQSDSLSAINSQFNDALAEIFPPESIFPLAKNCFVFEDGDGAADQDPSENVPVVVIPSLMGNKKLYIGTLLADLCSHILSEFGAMVCPSIYSPCPISFHHGFTGTSSGNPVGK
jgi:hypothetical protein